MKSTFFKPLSILFILILTVSCSVDSEENVEQLITADSTYTPSKNQNCADPDLLVSDGDHNFYYLLVEYEADATKQERNAIRNPYCDRMVSITPCELNKDAEIWLVRGLCPTLMDCKPDIVKPTDPNLRLATFADTCQ
ncbi:hypothetical protein [uncultured Dokdonia sp.]|uniref:hypothetical protein n=1 Tax=uncultured Dokdonia sp. TaxID=575653 RepID=UPI00261FDFFB|nr:hypothetical protein [uncultured Dokdonia sp.]